MASRAEAGTLRSSYRSTARTSAAARTQGRLTRLLFVVALLTFGIASIYTSLSLMRRTWPAIFPGRDIPFSHVIERVSLPGVVPIAAPNETSVFNKRINLLILGVDKRPGGQRLDRYNTDTLMVATIDPLSKQMSILSFPRDLWVDIHPPGGGVYEDRINASYSLGVQTGGSFDSGARQLETDIKANFGIDINYWVWLDFTGVEALINAIDGIDIDVPSDLAFGPWYYSDDDIHAQYISVPAGLQHLDGYHAVAFGRFRNDSDLYRVKRQQLVLRTALQKVFSRGMLNDPTQLWNAYRGTVETDVPFGKMPGYAALLKDTNGRTNFFSLGDPVNNIQTVEAFTTAGGADVLRWNHENVQYILSQVFTRAEYAQSSVEIQDAYAGDNSSARAAALGRYLAYTKHLPTVYLGPKIASQPETTVTLLSDGKRVLAEDIAKWMNIPASAIRTQTKADPSQPDVIVVVGQNFKLPGS